MTTPPNHPTPGAPQPHAAGGPEDNVNPGAQQGNWNPGQAPAAGGYVPPAGGYVPPQGGQVPGQAPQNFGQVPPQNFGQPPQQGFGQPAPGQVPPQNFGQVPPQNFGQPPQQNFGQPPQQGFGQPAPGQVPPQNFGQVPPGQWPAAGGGYPPPPGVGPGYGVGPTGYPMGRSGLGRGLRRGGSILAIRLGIAVVVLVVAAIGGFSRFHFGSHHHAPGDVHDAESSAVGQCAKIAGSDSAPVVINTDCSSDDANYKVAVKLSSSFGTCPTNDYLSVYRPGFEDNFKVCYQLNAREGECFKQDADDNYIQTPCTAEAKFRIGRIVTGEAESSACGADAESSNTLVYPQPSPETICLVAPTDSGN